MLLMLDNYDSFTYNLVQYLQSLGAEVKVVRNDAMTVDEIETLAPERIVISPGPGTPDQAGVTLQMIERLGQHTPILDAHPAAPERDILLHKRPGGVERSPLARVSIRRHKRLRVMADAHDRIQLRKGRFAYFHVHFIPSNGRREAKQAAGIFHGGLCERLWRYAAQARHLLRHIAHIGGFVALAAHGHRR